MSLSTEVSNANETTFKCKVSKTKQIIIPADDDRVFRFKDNNLPSPSRDGWLVSEDMMLA